MEQPIKRYEFTPILGWSVSRYDKFMSCKRQYYYDYYAKYDSVYPRHKIDTLKKMTSIPLEIGNIVHDMNKDTLERLLKSEKKIDIERFVKYARKKTETYCNSKTFTEVYYNGVSSINITELFDKVQKSLNNFLNSKRYDWLMKKALYNKKNWIIEPPGYGETRINGMKAYCKVDFLFPIDNELYILDWKTGKVNDKKHSKQLIGYSFWASCHFDKDSKEITPIIAYLLPEYTEKKIEIDEEDFQAFSAQVKKETDEMYSYCVDIEENIPIDKDEFAMTTNKIICNYCNYRELCK